jgi:opacity protein-like surface antigen
MKKIFTLLIGLTSALMLEANAQDNMSVGLMLSPSLESFVRNRSDIIDKSKLSYNFGLMGKYRFSDKTSLRTGLVIYNKGTRYDAPGGYPSRELVNHTWFLSIPLTVDYEIGINKNMAIGSSAGFIYGRKVWDFYIQNKEGKKHYVQPFNFISKDYLGFTFGIGPSFMLSSNLNIDIRPTYVRQLNDGWYNKWEPSSEVERLNSFLIDMTLWFYLK